MNKHIDEQYLDICKKILEKGTNKSDRTGTGTKSIFSAQIEHDMSDGFPLLNTKRVYWKGVVTELIWFLRGDTNIEWLLENNNNIWVGDAYKRYHQSFPETEMMSKEDFINKIKTDKEFANKWGELGPIYGSQWRDWHIIEPGIYTSVDQIQQAIDTLKTNPDSRRNIVSAWNVGELGNMVLPPCHWAFEFYTEELENGKRRLSLKWHQRSVDTPLGLPFNIASYALLLKIVAKEVNMIPGTLIGDLSNVHIYNNQIEGIKEQISRPIKDDYAELVFKDEFYDLIEQDIPFSEKIDQFKPEWFTIENYTPMSTIKMPLSN